MAEQAITDRTPDVDKPKNEEQFLRQAVKRFNRAAVAESINRKEAVDDLRFKKGEQWPADIRSQRTIEKRPCLTINKCKTFIHQITNDQRQNRPAINISPVGDKSDPNTAKMLKGLIRQIERQSNADVAYDTGFDNAVSNGFGYWRVLTEYEDEDSFDQVVRIGRIRNPFRVYLDPDHQEPDGSDIEWAFISDLITREEFKDKYPKADPMNWDDAGMGDEYKEWTNQTHVRIAEYFYCEYEKRRLLALTNGHVGFYEELEPGLKALVDANPKMVAKEREVQTREICWDTITAKQVLEHNDWAGKWIPIIKVIGDEVDVEGKVNLSGIVRDAKDPQRMYNFWCTAETELIALAPKAPWIMEEGQVEGHEKRWQEANTKSFPYLLYKGTSLAGKPSPPPQRQQFVGPPTGVVNAKIGAAQDMQAVTGIRFDATMQERMYDESGKALRELKRVGDLGNFHYVDNLSRSLRHTGRILIDLIPKIYDTPRVLTILREDDTEEHVKLDPSQAVPYMKGKSPNGQKPMGIFNPKVGEYEVAVTIGPSFATKRAEASESMIEFLKVLPQTAPMVADLIAKNQDWPGAEEIYERLASQLPPNLQKASTDDFPPEARAMIQSLQTNLQKLSQEHQQALAMLGDKSTDQEIERDKINKDFEAKLTKVVADYEAKVAGMAQDNFQKITDMVQQMQQEFQKQNIMAEAGAKIKDAEDKAEKAKEEAKQTPTSMRQGDIGNIAKIAESMNESHKAMIDTVKNIGEVLSKPKRGKIKGPSGKVYELSTE
jgi:portal protein